MQFSRNWLKDFIDLNLTTEDICSQLTMAGVEVDGYDFFNSKLTGKDSIIKLDITPNRGDCFSVFGVARELAVINNLKLKYPASKLIKSSFKGPESRIKNFIETVLIKRFTQYGIVIKNNQITLCLSLRVAIKKAVGKPIIRHNIVAPVA